MKCPCCGSEVEEDICEVQGCTEVAEHEGWYRVLDPFLQTPTGLIQRRRVCGEHVNMLIGQVPNEANKAA